MLLFGCGRNGSDGPYENTGPRRSANRQPIINNRNEHRISLNIRYVSVFSVPRRRFLVGPIGKRSESTSSNISKVTFKYIFVDGGHQNIDFDHQIKEIHRPSLHFRPLPECSGRGELVLGNPLNSLFDFNDYLQPTIFILSFLNLESEIQRIIRDPKISHLYRRLRPRSQVGNPLPKGSEHF